MAERAVGEIDVRHSEAQEVELERHYALLEPEARDAYVNFFLARTPAHLQDDMKDLVEQNLPNPPDPVEGGATMARSPEADSPEARKVNMGAPRSQRVDVEAIAQAAAHAAGRDAADKARAEARENQTLNPGNPTKPLVNIEPGVDGPVIMPGEMPDETARASPGYQTTVLTPAHPEQYSDTPAVAPPLPDAYEPPRQQ